jgi:endoglucanase
MKTRFVDQGVGVIMGEYGAYPKPAYPQMSTYTNYWAEYVTRSMVQHGLVPMWWDTGGMIDRTTGAVREPALLNAIRNASN